MSYSFFPASASDRPRLADLGLLTIRLFTVLTFAYYQLAHQLRQAIDHLWEEAPWSLVSQLGDRGLPSPELLAPLGIALMTTTLMGVLLGFLTRLNALLFALMTGFVLFSALSLSPTLNPQTLALYLGVFLGFAGGGAGRLSLDHLLAGRRRPVPAE